MPLSGEKGQELGGLLSGLSRTYMEGRSRIWAWIPQLAPLLPHSRGVTSHFRREDSMCLGWGEWRGQAGGVRSFMGAGDRESWEPKVHCD